MTTAGWASCLDTFADHLAHQRALLAAGSPELLVEFVPEPGLGALPVTLLPRARQLQGEADALAEAVRDQMSRTLAAIARLRRPVETPRPSFVDSRC